MKISRYSLSQQGLAPLLIAVACTLVACPDRGAGPGEDCEDDQDCATGLQCTDEDVCAVVDPLDLDDLEAAEEEFDFRLARTCGALGLHACAPDETPRPVQWHIGAVSYQINREGTRDLHDDEEITESVRDSVIDSFDVWADQECTSLELNYNGLTDQEQIGVEPDTPPEENVNIVVWHDDSWPYPTYNAVALATITFQRSTGQILGADIELNSANFDFTDSDTDVEIDLQNTVAHEVGHFIGFEHSPDPEATMFATVAPGETSKRDLHEADIAGLCYVYPE